MSNVAKACQHTNKKNSPINTQSHRSNSVFPRSVRICGSFFCGIWRSQRITPIAVMKKTRLPHSIGDEKPLKSQAPAYVHQVLIRSPERNAAAKRCGSDTNG